MPIDLKSPAMLTGLRKRYATPATHIADLLFPEKNPKMLFDRIILPVDKNVSRRMSTFRSHDMESINVKRTDAKTYSIDVAEINESTQIEWDTIKDLPAGTDPFTGAPAADQLVAGIIADDYKILDNRFANLKEYIATTLLDQGKITIAYDGKEVTWDYLRPANLTEVLTGAALFTDQLSDPFEVFRDLVSRVKVASGAVPLDVYLGSDVEAALMDHTKFMDKFNKLNVNLGNIDPFDLNENVSYIGRLARPNVRLWTYSGLRGDGTPHLAANKFWMVTPGAKGATHFGRVKSPKVNGPQKVFVDRHSSENPEREYLRYRSAPAMEFINADCHAVCTAV